MLTSDHDDTDSSISAQLNGASDLLTRGIQHTHAANKGQVSLRKEMFSCSHSCIQYSCSLSAKFIRLLSSHLIIGKLG